MRQPMSILLGLLAPFAANAGPAAQPTLPPAADVVALFEFDGDVLDSSGNGRDAVLLGGEFVVGRHGGALRVQDVSSPMGIDWSAHAALLVAPYTVEMVLVPGGTSSYAKLFSPDDSDDSGWYYVSLGFRAYSAGTTLGSGQARAHQTHYLAIVSSVAGQIEVFLNGRSLGVSPEAFVGAPVDAVFFRDDSGTGRNEGLDAVIEVLRISDVARSAAEIEQIAAPFPFYRDSFETP